jgi:L-asparaginase II
MSNPILIEITRGSLVESAHRGSVAVVDAGGASVLLMGDTVRPIFVRSAIKLIQALPMIETGAASRYGFGESEIALACGSHTGADLHVGVGQAMLERLNVDSSCLACGVALPSATKSMLALAASGKPPMPFHHMCSGKHIGMLAAALGGGLAGSQSMAAYVEPTHPVQRHIEAALADLSGELMGERSRGGDGCGVPTWAMSLHSLAGLFAKVGTGTGMGRDRADALHQVLAACWAKPELVAGRGRAETVVMTALPGKIYLKSGAEGVYCGAVPHLGIGFAVKIDDGAMRAAAATVMPLVERLLPEARGLIKRGVLMNAQGVEIGAIRTSNAYRDALERIPT